MDRRNFLNLSILWFWSAMLPLGLAWQNTTSAWAAADNLQATTSVEESKIIHFPAREFPLILPDDNKPLKVRAIMWQDDVEEFLWKTLFIPKDLLIKIGTEWGERAIKDSTFILDDDSDAGTIDSNGVWTIPAWEVLKNCGVIKGTAKINDVDWFEYHIPVTLNFLDWKDCTSVLPARDIKVLCPEEGKPVTWTVLWWGTTTSIGSEEGLPKWRKSDSAYFLVPQADGTFVEKEKLDITHEDVYGKMKGELSVIAVIIDDKGTKYYREISVCFVKIEDGKDVCLCEILAKDWWWSSNEPKIKIPNNIQFTEPLKSVYPNPMKDKVTLEFQEDVVVSYVQLYNVSGQVVWTYTVEYTPSWLQIDVSELELPAWFYFIHPILKTEKWRKNRSRPTLIQKV